MRRFAKYLILTAGIAACDSATEAVAPYGAEHSPAFAAANSSVDPGTLIPVPPEGAVCRADGPWTICHTDVSSATVNEPVLDLTCGTVYETGTDIRQSIRWYNDENKLVRYSMCTSLSSWFATHALGLAALAVDVRRVGSL